VSWNEKKAPALDTPGRIKMTSNNPNVSSFPANVNPGATWTTRAAPEHTRAFGVEEIHVAWFTPRGWPGAGTVVGLCLPECEMQVSVLTPGGEAVVMVNRPTTNKKTKYWLRAACARAREESAAVIISTDTADQSERAARTVERLRLLPGYERAALERIYDPRSRARGKLS
jgi:hypothetical protein